MPQCRLQSRYFHLPGQKKVLKNVQSLATQKITKDDLSKIQFFLPEDFFLFLDELEANRNTQTETVKGYKVKVKYKPVDETSKKSKRQAITEILLKTLDPAKEDKKAK